ncbi:hypothetical protein AB4Z39_04980 [Mycobacterium adipatum]|uniref:hypothetical protein n=1 Tax=Mycobacterium adipatum TaxID=1682113 RepID=UPI0034E0D68C
MHSTVTGRAVTLIGGPARVGKTTLARRLVVNSPVELVHLDHLLHAVTSVADADARASLQKAPSIDNCSPDRWLSEIRQRDRVLWTAASAYIATAAADMGQLVMEGGLWPDWVRGLPGEYVAVFLVDTGDSADRLVDVARADPRSWMAKRNWPEDKMRRWADYNRLRSEMIADLACEHGYPVFDIRDGIGPAIDRAFRELNSSAVH